MIASLHVASEDVDPERYPVFKDFKWHLPGMVKSAEMMAGLVQTDKVSIIRNPTVAELKERLNEARQLVKPGDTFVFSYHGHGSYVPTSFNADVHFSDAYDAHHISFDNFEDTILLKDRMMLQGEYGAILETFPAGVRYINIIDSCESGTFVFASSGDSQAASAKISSQSERGAATPPAIEGFAARLFRGAPHAPLSLSKATPKDMVQRVYAMFKSLYDTLGRLHNAKPVVDGIHFASCEVGQVGYVRSDGSGTEFMIAMHAAMTSRQPPTSYKVLRDDVTKRLHAANFHMDPPLFPFGTNASWDWLDQKPFHLA